MMDSQPLDSSAAGSEAGLGYQVIARRYRPRFFREVVGQEATAETLRQAILNERIAHAYLFCGPRGVGKTSMARIFARALQCAESKNGDPCDKCETCDRIFCGEDMNVTEMDGASNRGIEDVRELIQHVRYAPTAGNFRVFIIDEVHMLTREAFNALLKTLEEPPPHVKFLFCTTEPEKIPPTVISRCQRCDFGAISGADIVRRLEQICGSEGATPEDGLLDRVADLARGGMRDSQSLLDQLLSFAGTSPTLDDLDRITGRLSQAGVSALVGIIEAGDRAGVVRELDQIAAGGTDPSVLLEQIVEEFRDRLHAGVEGGWGDGEIERNLLAQEILQEARLRIRQLSRADIVLELALLRLSTLSDLVPLRELVSRLEGEGSPGEPRAPAAPAAGGAASSTSAPPPGSSTKNRSSTMKRPAQSPVDAQAPVDSTPSPAPAPVQVSASSSEATPAASPIPPADPPPVAEASDGEAEPEEASLDPDAKRAVACIDQVSAILARMVGDGVRVQGDTVTIRMNAMAHRQLDGPKKDALRSALEREFGRTMRCIVEKAEAPSSSSEPESGGAPSAPDSTEPPEIVQKAQEIFRGSVHSERRPPS